MRHYSLFASAFFIILALFCSFGCGSNSSYVAPKKIDAVGMQQLLDSHKNSIIVDVRTSGEFTNLHIKGAVNIPLDKILSGSFPLPDKNTYIFVYCRSGKRSAEAAEHLARDGYSNVYDLGALSNWRGLVERGSAVALSKAPALGMGDIRRVRRKADIFWNLLHRNKFWCYNNFSS